MTELSGFRDVIGHVSIGLAICDFLYVVSCKHTSILHGYGYIKPRPLDTGKWQSSRLIVAIELHKKALLL